MQKWEYLTIFRTRGWEAKGKDEYWHTPGEWSSNLNLGDTELPFTYKGIHEALKILGELGWELVSVSTSSGYLGGKDYTNSSFGIALDIAGYTTAERWVFKRPKE